MSSLYVDLLCGTYEGLFLDKLKIDCTPMTISTNANGSHAESTGKGKSSCRIIKKYPEWFIGVVRNEKEEKDNTKKELVSITFCDYF